MKYKMQIYCRVPDSVEMTESMKREIIREMLVINGYVELTFSSRDALFHYVRSKDYVKSEVVSIKKPNRGDLKRFAHIPRAIGNHILKATMTHENDNQRHKIGFYKKPDVFYFVGYLVRDDTGRTVDLRNYETELYKFDNDFYISKLRKSQEFGYFSNIGSEQWYAKWAEKIAEMESLYGKGWEHYNGLRGLHTLQSRRLASDKEYRHLIRGRRRKLPEPWGTEIPIRYSKSWKDRRKGIDICSNLKLKWQWQVNLPVHMDTMQFDKKEFAFDINEVDLWACLS